MNRLGKEKWPSDLSVAEQSPRTRRTEPTKPSYLFQSRMCVVDGPGRATLSMTLQFDNNCFTWAHILFICRTTDYVTRTIIKLIYRMEWGGVARCRPAARRLLLRLTGVSMGPLLYSNGEGEKLKKWSSIKQIASLKWL